jgi:hypothetical protein
MVLLADADIPRIGEMSYDNSTLRIKTEMDPASAQIACMNYDAEAATGPGPSPTTMEVLQQFDT